jgi:ppGpp synthetase/RelA/SpoT-type nucleotidyltranferase
MGEFMYKLLQAFFVLMAISSQANTTAIKLPSNIDANKLLPFSQPNRRNAYTKDLAGLYSVKAFQSNHIKQPYNDFNLLYQNAIVGQNELENITQFIASATATNTFSSGVKSQLRALDKINNKLSGNNEQITDLARTSIVAKDVPALMDAFELIEQKTQILRIKNRFKNPGASGYRDISLLVRLPETKIVAEVQIHLEAFSVIKNGEEHGNYQQIQKIERIQLKEDRALSEIEQASIHKLRKQSKQMYQNAWNQYLSA